MDGRFVSPTAKAMGHPSRVQSSKFKVGVLNGAAQHKSPIVNPQSSIVNPHAPLVAANGRAMYCVCLPVIAVEQAAEAAEDAALALVFSADAAGGKHAAGQA